MSAPSQVRVGVPARDRETLERGLTIINEQLRDGPSYAYTNVV